MSENTAGELEAALSLDAAFLDRGWEGDGKRALQEIARDLRSAAVQLKRLSRHEVVLTGMVESARTERSRCRAQLRELKKDATPAAIERASKAASAVQPETLATLRAVGKENPNE